MILLKTAHVRTLVVLGSVMLTLNSSAQMTGSDVESQLLLCAGRATDTVRLACYDGLVESLRPAGPRSKADRELNAESDTSVDQPAESKQEPLQVDNTTGVPLPTGNKPSAKPSSESFDSDVSQKQSIRIMIEKTKRNARGDWYFYFDNGEVWKQIDTRGRRIPPLPVAATVSRGIFSSHKLHIDGEVWSMKIRRVK